MHGKPWYTSAWALLVGGLALVACSMASAPEPPQPVAGKTLYTGVNLASAEFGINNNGTRPSPSYPGVYGKDWVYPTLQEVDYFSSKGMNMFRIPFAWERMQPEENGPLDATAISELKPLVEHATVTRGAVVILDMHNYAFRYRKALGREVDKAVFADVWRRIAEEFKGNSKVFFGLMNEPHDNDRDPDGTVVWRESAQAAIDAIRSTGANNAILVSGNGWSHGYNWVRDTLSPGSTASAWYGKWNGEELAKLTDSANNLIFDIHEYVDQPDRNGTSDGPCFDKPAFAEMMEPLTAWLREHKRTAILGEFSFPADQPTCTGFWREALSYMRENGDVWLGWAYWAAGPRWGDYCGKLCLEPVFNPDGSVVDKPQMQPLEPFLGGKGER
ncbi:MAG: glycoside hydrolase family 5 protein [Chloroflexaceae bacterium]|nr:glycoside hydrolase family 5 protein [Chloroflexaceae bacterium]